MKFERYIQVFERVFIRILSVLRCLIRIRSKTVPDPKHRLLLPFIASSIHTFFCIPLLPVTTNNYTSLCFPLLPMSFTYPSVATYLPVPSTHPSVFIPSTLSSVWPYRIAETIHISPCFPLFTIPVPSTHPSVFPYCLYH